LEEALKSQGKEPISEICIWNRELREAIEGGTITSVVNNKSRYKPTAAKPFVFHLHGSINYPLSMVLTEQDYNDFLVEMLQSEMSLIPAIIRMAVTKSSLLFIGYSITDANFTSIFQGALSFMSNVPRNRPSIATISVPSISSDTIKQEKVLKYLRQNAASKYQIEVHWTYSNQFIDELKTKWNNFKNNSSNSL
jgi:hypothetical protein